MRKLNASKWLLLNERIYMIEKDRIPKTIHYCWFGEKPLSPISVKCIESWRKWLPEYEIREWNEKNFDINSNAFVKEAYTTQKWAFVADYARLKVLYEHGGIYMDTDVEVVKPLDEFLGLPAFSGFECCNAIPTGIIGAIKNNQWIGELLEYYQNRKFVKEDGKLDMTTNVSIITEITRDLYPVELNNSIQHLKEVSFYPVDWFCAYNFETGKVTITKNTYTVHHFSGSWLPPIKKMKVKLTRLLGKKMMKRLSLIKSYIIRKGRQK